jgi:predicted ATPase
LALELAAARVRSLSIQQINARLDDCFKLLTGGARTALPRQQTLRATLDWSHDLLAEQERAVLRRLAIFPGSFTLAAASSIASDEAIDEFAVIDLVSQLVARSLVIADTEDAGARYRLLETTRAYALEKLAEAGEGGAIERRHAQYFRGLFDRAPDDWMRTSDAKWSAIYGSERDNIRAALDWAFRDGGDPAIGIALAGASGRFGRSCCSFARDRGGSKPQPHRLDPKQRSWTKRGCGSGWEFCLARRCRCSQWQPRSAPSTSTDGWARLPDLVSHSCIWV